MNQTWLPREIGIDIFEVISYTMGNINMIRFTSRLYQELPIKRIYCYADPYFKGCLIYEIYGKDPGFNYVCVFNLKEMEESPDPIAYVDTQVEVIKERYRFAYERMKNGEFSHMVVHSGGIDSESNLAIVDSDSS